MPLALLPWPASVTPLDQPAVRPDAEPVFSPVDDCGPEGYRLRVDAAGIRIEASTPAGRFYALRTLAQLADATGAVPAVDISDEPRFAHRGLMLDVARHFHPVETVEAVIERASSLKLNALHLHLTDDHGWRLQLRSYPELTEHGSGSAVDGDPGGFYTRDDYARIVAHAAAHHMIVIPEFDLPGHTHALGLSHPELVADPVISDHLREVTESYGGALPERGVPYTALGVGFSSLRADAEGLEPLLRDVFSELAELTPGPYLHFGGDEALGTAPEDYRRMAALAARLIAETGKTPISWHEAGVADLPAGSIGQYWGFRTPREGHDERARAFVAGGGRLILSPADAIYLDMKYDAQTPLGLVWADGPTSVERSYAWDPDAVIPDVPESAILGVEACLWSETVRTLADIDALMFPRIASAAELGWSRSPARDSFTERIAGLADAWTAAGIGFHRAEGVPWR
ncbi:family 20 glycosylhydrolase [Microbacterium rhizophilus]|uniref:family 20 glycosylhydrolase n=1 Tax=Microbacterium rhizophilus TaxID=3138934 RepID=UPI0031E6BB82